MAVQINGNAMPARMANEGKVYRWMPAPIVAKNGRGRGVQAGYPSLVWQWTYLTDTEWDWWMTTIMGGTMDIEATGTTELFDDEKNLRSISSCVVNRPVAETIRYGIYYNVQVLIEQIVLAS